MAVACALSYNWNCFRGKSQLSQDKQSKLVKREGWVGGEESGTQR